MSDSEDTALAIAGGSIVVACFICTACVLLKDIIRDFKSWRRTVNKDGISDSLSEV